MLELIFAATILIYLRSRNGSGFEPSSDQHPSLKPRQYETVSRETWDKHDRPYLGPERERTADFYRSRHVSKAVKKLPKTLPF